MSDGVLFRPAETRDDLKFMIKSWLRDYCHPRNPWAGSLERELQMRALKETITLLMKNENVYICMACNEENPDQIFGFVCYEDGHDYPVLHYVYVKALMRGNNIGSDLVAIARGKAKGVMRYTFRTPACRKFLQGAKFNPNLVRRYRNEESHATGQGR